MINYRKYHQGQLIHTRKVIAIFIILFFITISVKGQNEETLISLNKPKIEAIIDTVINCFEKHYVYPEKVLEIKNVILDNFKKGEFMIDISGTNINPPTFGEDDYSEPTILYEVVLRIGWGSISLKRFNTYKGKDLNEMNNRNLEKAQELRTQILDLLN